ncbi:MAG TPA: response regulator [Candidatus Omnitrophota bacterium]|nr:response regulator [Candidatus Omnitrophota bacterium]HRZ14410.1 response regulator [Candidatus Omnitrophota bacterium]
MSKGKVIIVDDDKEFLEELKETLMLSGYEVFETAQADLVQHQANFIKPDVILLDLKMNDMNGFEVADELRQFTATMGIPIIAMTGFFREDEHVPLLNICGIQKCLKKPFNPLDVIVAIEGVLKKK